MAKGRRKPKHTVNPAERVAATPETIAKARGCILAKLYVEKEIDSGEMDSGYEIMSAFRVITNHIGYKPLNLDRLAGHGTMGPKAERLYARYVEWGNELIRRRHIRPHVVVEWLEMERRLDRGAVPTLRHALRDWGTA